MPGVNYFGLWFSALDSGNLLQFYNGATLVYSFTPADFISLVGACSSSNPFCGNPNNKTQDTGEQFAFLNFFDTDGYFNKIVFSEPTSGGGFESDNHTVAYIDPITASGTVIESLSDDPPGTPEPATLGLMALGLALVASRLKRPRTPLGR